MLTSRKTPTKTKPGSKIPPLKTKNSLVCVQQNVLHCRCLPRNWKQLMDRWPYRPHGKVNRKYWVIQKKLFTWRFKHNQDYLGWYNFCNREYWQSTISMQVLNIFGDGQNCQNQTFKWLYQLNESKYEKSFFGKILTVMLFHMYQVFSSLLGHLHFSLHFFSTFMEQLFLNHPISKLFLQIWKYNPAFVFHYLVHFMVWGIASGMLV